MRAATALVATGREYARTPVLLALLVAVPAYVVGVITRVAPDGRLPVTVDGTRVVASAPDLYGVLMAPMAAALVAGITGLFLVQSGREADGRLVLAGFHPAEVVTARLGLLGGVGLLATAVAVGALWTTFQPDAVGWFVAAVLLGAVTYGLVGALVGTLFDRLPGTYLLLFAPSLDLFLFQNPAAAAPPLAEWLPGHYAVELAMQAAFTEVDPAVLGWGAAYVAGLVVLVVVAYARLMRT